MAGTSRNVRNLPPSIRPASTAPAGSTPAISRALQYVVGVVLSRYAPTLMSIPRASIWAMRSSQLKKRRMTSHRPQAARARPIRCKNAMPASRPGEVMPKKSAP